MLFYCENTRPMNRMSYTSELNNKFIFGTTKVNIMLQLNKQIAKYFQKTDKNINTTPLFDMCT